jgi:hypothetical protein
MVDGGASYWYQSKVSTWHVSGLVYYSALNTVCYSKSSLTKQTGMDYPNHFSPSSVPLPQLNPPVPSPTTTAPSFVPLVYRPTRAPPWHVPIRPVACCPSLLGHSCHLDNGDTFELHSPARTTVQLPRVLTVTGPDQGGIG